MHINLSNKILNIIKKNIENNKKNDKFKMNIIFGQFIDKNKMNKTIGKYVFKQIYNNMQTFDESIIIVDKISNNIKHRTIYNCDKKFMDEHIFNESKNKLYTIGINTQTNIFDKCIIIKKNKKVKHNFYKYGIRIDEKLKNDNENNDENNINNINMNTSVYDKIIVKYNVSINNKFCKNNVSVVLVKRQNKFVEIYYVLNLELINICDMNNDNNIDNILLEINNFYVQYNNIIYYNFKMSIDEQLFNHYIKMKYNDVIGIDTFNFEMISKSMYALTDKADGYRLILYANNFNEVYIINYRLNIEKKICNCTEDIKNTVIDGEFVNENEYLAFDIIYYKKKCITEKNLKIRLNKLNKITNIIKKSNIIKYLNYSQKNFYYDDIFKKSKEIWENKKNLFNYELDGLIYTPIYSTYNSENTHLKTYKWKCQISIDVRILYNKKTKFSVFNAEKYKTHYNNKYYDKTQYESFDEQFYNPIIINNKHLSFNIFKNNNMINEKGLLGQYYDYKTNINDIAELYFDMEKKQWILLRIRTDKNNANSAKTIVSSMLYILDNLTIDEIYNTKYILSPYAIYIKDNKIDNKEKYDEIIKYNDDKSNVMWRTYQNFVKNEIIKKSKNIINPFIDIDNKIFLLDLGCGKGGDINKWISMEITDVLAIDISALNIYGQKDSEGMNGFLERLETYKGNNGEKFIINNNTYELKYNENKTLNITVVCGDISKNILSGDCGKNNFEKQKILNFFKNAKKNNFCGFHIISIMFTIHYVFENSNDNINIFMNNIISLLHKKGVIIGTFIDGDYILKHIEQNNSFMVRNFFYSIIYKTTKHKNMKSDNVKSNLILVDVYQNIWGNIYITEPLINFKLLNDLFNKYNLSIINKDTSFKIFYDDFMKKKKKLNIWERLLVLNKDNFFIYSFSS